MAQKIHLMAKASEFGKGGARWDGCAEVTPLSTIYCVIVLREYAGWIGPQGLRYMPMSTFPNLYNHTLPRLRYAGSALLVQADSLIHLCT